ncbi:hypothetical protein CTI12_AA432340 [Artemisia annua]|uniref:Uncharacterized protein n=1 Tax=Artemisia annua TaxID=35608 RepID=A0A2U1LZC6_ARTAN|nr:hypothetical protein CTI12_AA432340 [Artemisia annua]
MPPTAAMFPTVYDSAGSVEHSQKDGLVGLNNSHIGSLVSVDHTKKDSPVCVNHSQKGSPVSVNHSQKGSPVSVEQIQIDSPIILTRSIFQRTAKAFLADNLHCRLWAGVYAYTKKRLRNCAKEDYFGGHAKTVTMDDGVDLELGFMDDVKTFMPNWVTYHNMLELFEALGIDIELSDM